MFSSLFIIITITILYYIIENSFSTRFLAESSEYTVPEYFKIEALDNNSTISKIEETNNRDKNKDFKSIQFSRVNRGMVVNDKLKKYNQQLTRALRTLEYINIMETNSKLKRTTFQRKELIDLKANVQRQVLRLSKQIKDYKLHQNSSIAA